MMINHQRNIMIVAALLIVGAVATAAIVHNANKPLAAPAAVYDSSLQAPGQYANNTYNPQSSQQYAPNGQPYYTGNQAYVNTQPYADNSYASANSVAATDGYYPMVGRPLYVRQPAATYPAPGDAQYAEQRVDDDSYVESTPGHRVYYERDARHHGRSKKHSVEIVAGTAAAGAAIGAIAGGGKGAAIGGLSGAGAGFFYDRLTHNH